MKSRAQELAQAILDQVTTEQAQEIEPMLVDGVMCACIFNPDIEPLFLEIGLLIGAEMGAAKGPLFQEFHDALSILTAFKVQRDQGTVHYYWPNIPYGRE